MNMCNAFFNRSSLIRTYSEMAVGDKAHATPRMELLKRDGYEKTCREVVFDLFTLL